MAFAAPLRPRDVADYDPREHGARCSICPLKKEAYVPAEGEKRPKLVVVGEQPGATEKVVRRPFIGRSGRLLDTTLDEVGLSRGDAWVTNAALCHTDNENDAARAAECCAPRLHKELAGISPEVPIVALGKSAARSVLGVKSILLTRGFVWTARDLTNPIKSAEAAIRKAGRAGKIDPDLLLRRDILAGRHKLAGRTVFPTVHPAFVLRADVWTPIFQLDMSRVARWVSGDLARGKLLDDIRFQVVSRDEEVRKSLSRLADLVACDIETDGKNPITAHILCVGVSDGKKTTVVGPWRKSRHAKLLTDALAKRTTSFHNGFNFDHIALERDGVRLDMTRIEDTLLGHHAFASHFPQRLDHVVSVFVDASTPWKIEHGRRGGAEEKGLLPVDMETDDLHLYNAGDSVRQALSWLGMQNDLATERHVYEHDKQLAALCKEMYVTGIRRDEPHAQMLSRKMRRRAAALKGEMRSIIRKQSFGPSRLEDVRKALRRLGVGTLFLTPTGQVSTASATLEAIAAGETRAASFATALLKWRAVGKARSTYIDAPDIQALSDGRFHPNWKPFGTVTGRLSSRAQSMPRLVFSARAIALMKRNPKWKTKDIEAALERDATFDVESRVREIYIPGPGKVFLYFDLSQSEMRAAAYLAGDENFIKSCESGDVHTANAKILFPEFAEVLERDPKGEGKQLRDITKNAGFGILYDALASTIHGFLRSKGFDVEIEQVEAMFSFIREHYARYYEFCHERLVECRKEGMIRTAIVGRPRWFGYFPKETEVYNFSVQSLIGDLMNLRLIELRPRLPRSAKPVFQGHDSLCIEVSAGRDARITESLIRELWAKPIFVPTSGKTFVMPIDFKEGGRLSDF